MLDYVQRHDRRQHVADTGSSPSNHTVLYILHTVYDGADIRNKGSYASPQKILRDQQQTSAQSPTIRYLNYLTVVRYVMLDMCRFSYHVCHLFTVQHCCLDLC